MSSLFFISTNEQWSGSEELWSASLKKFHEQGYQVSYSASYESKNVDTLPGTRLPYYRRSLSILEKVLIKFHVWNVNIERLTHQLKEVNPSLVLISQGNNIECLPLMEGCRELNIPFVTITQLVAEAHLYNIGDHNLKRLQSCYETAQRNFFVSYNNLHLHNRMLGKNFGNSERIYNPCRIRNSTHSRFPTSELFTVAMVGRIECYHKGYDLLIEVLKQEKWRSRPVHFNLYGDGPHRQLLEDMILSSNSTLVSIRGYKDDLTSIWNENQILLMTSRMEGQALTLIEAMWMKRAAIVTDVGGAGELIEEGKTGFVADSATVNSIDAALERAWSTRHSWKEMGEAAFASFQHKHPADEVEYFNERVRLAAGIV